MLTALSVSCIPDYGRPSWALDRHWITCRSGSRDNSPGPLVLGSRSLTHLSAHNASAAYDATRQTAMLKHRLLEASAHWCLPAGTFSPSFGSEWLVGYTQAGAWICAGFGVYPPLVRCGRR